MVMPDAAHPDNISIHALREEGDVVMRIIAAWSMLFLSTPSARRATSIGPHRQRVDAISIHALREEGDFWPIRLCQNLRYFYPRPPRGGRRAGTSNGI